MKNTLNTLGAFKKSALVGCLLVGTALAASAQEGSGNAGADAVIAKVETLTAVAAAVVAAAVLVVVVPWGAKMAVRAFKSIGGA